MAQITLRGNPIHTVGELPAVGSKAPDALLVNGALETVHLASLGGTKVLNIFPSVDTPVCAMSVRAFNARAGALDGVSVLNISADLPFAGKRFCGAEGLTGVQMMSTFRGSFAKDFGLEIADGPLAGLCSRAVVVVNTDGIVVHVEQVPEIGQEPNYDAALAALK
ncbi:MAG: thiol peroxidase [Myxococcales bacterium]|nr:thiol peroxidase [Myxococcales bacterium]